MRRDIFDEEGRRRFIDELSAAVMNNPDVSESDVLESVQQVLTAWYRTALVVDRPGFEAELQRSLQSETEEPMTVGEIRRLFGERRHTT